jgi:hypothetical protein
MACPPAGSASNDLIKERASRLFWPGKALIELCTKARAAATALREASSDKFLRVGKAVAAALKDVE